MIQLIRRFFEDINRIANAVNANRTQDISVTLSQEDRNLLANFHRRRPSVKKEAL